MKFKSSDAQTAPAGIPDTRPTGQMCGLERGKATHRKHPGKRARSGAQDAGSAKAPLLFDHRIENAQP